jgi:hypothetical protein
MREKKDSRHQASSLLLTSVLIVLVGLICTATSQTPAKKAGTPGAASLGGGVPSIPTPEQWPDLTVLDNFTNPRGDTCTIDGAAQPNTEKARLNRLKNRFRLPQGGQAGFSEITFEELLQLPHGEIDEQRNTVVNFPGSGHTDNRRAVSFVGFVKDVFAAGCRRRPNGRGGESVNCNTTDRDLCDAHINLVMDPDNNDEGGRGVIVVEVTERSRRLARQGLLPSNIGNNWSTPMLRARLLNRWVRFSGWLYFDTDHHDQAWILDGDDSVGRSNFRETAWEIHPVMGIEVTTAPDFFFDRLRPDSVLNIRPVEGAAANRSDATAAPSVGASPGAPMTREQVLRRIEALEKELRELKEAIRRLP